MSPRPSARYRPFVQKLLACGHWRMTNRTTDGGAKGVLEHVDSAATVCFATSDNGHEWNNARNMAHDAERICGCSFVEHRNRRRSRKAPERSGFSLEGTRRNDTGEDARRARHGDLLGAQQATITTLERMVADGATREAGQVALRLRDIEERLAETYLPYTPYRGGVLHDATG